MAFLTLLCSAASYHLYECITLSGKGSKYQVPLLSIRFASLESSVDKIKSSTESGTPLSSSEAQ